MCDLTKAKDLLKQNDCTCVLVKGEEVLTSQKSGIAPLLGFIDGGKDLSGFCAADKIVGKAAALLYVCMKVSAVYAEVLSVAAQKVFEKFGITCDFKTLAQNIINRRGDGVCPMEDAVKDIDDPRQAYLTLKQKVVQL